MTCKKDNCNNRCEQRCCDEPCLDCNEAKPDVRYRTTSDRRDGKSFPRCEDCWEKREARARQTMNRYPEAFIGPDPLDFPDW